VLYLRYPSAELRRRKGRTILTALGLAVGVGMVAIVVAVSKGLDDAQSKVLAPLTRTAVVHALERTASTITCAGIILAGTFAVFAVAGGGSMGGQPRGIGFGLAVGILMDTFVVRTLLVPSTVMLVGSWSWWPSQLARRGDHPQTKGRQPLAPAPLPRIPK
jgi:uncharacterized membrane protein YdfJ with MMPL/SSD domain